LYTLYITYIDNVNPECKGPLICMTKWFEIQYSTSYIIIKDILGVKRVMAVKETS